MSSRSPCPVTAPDVAEPFHGVFTSSTVLRALLEAAGPRLNSKHLAWLGHGVDHAAMLARHAASICDNLAAYVMSDDAGQNGRGAWLETQEGVADLLRHLGATFDMIDGLATIADDARALIEREGGGE